MKEHYLNQLRNQSTSTLEFRKNAQKLTLLLAEEAASLLSLKSPPILVAILRSGLAMLPSFLELFPDAPIGFLGMRRDEKTFQPHLYYENLPPIKPDANVFLLDPIVATGGSSRLALQKICEAGVRPEKIVFTAILASRQGASLLTEHFPKVRCHFAAVDEKLDKQAYIVPGLGDFGDRFFGT